YNNERKQPNSIFYVLDVSKNEAYWASHNKEVDDFTKQFLGENPTKGSYVNNTTSSKYRTRVQMHTKAQIKLLQKPLIEVTADTIIENDRQLTFQIVSQRNANKIELVTHKPIKFKSFKINNEALKNKLKSEYVLNVNYGTIMRYFRTSEDEIIEMEIVVDKNQKFDFDVFEIKYDLFTNPEFEIKPRSENMMPTPFIINDATVIKTHITF
ncbi:MAG: hypothetical protein IZT56_11765, partial [Bacteroidetes bacterium]|nr:hypothetical protein [Bacteroidota bacterium]